MRIKKQDSSDSVFTYSAGACDVEEDQYEIKQSDSGESLMTYSAPAVDQRPILKAYDKEEDYIDNRTRLVRWSSETHTSPKKTKRRRGRSLKLTSEEKQYLYAFRPDLDPNCEEVDTTPVTPQRLDIQQSMENFLGNVLTQKSAEEDVNESESDSDSDSDSDDESSDEESDDDEDVALTKRRFRPKKVIKKLMKKTSGRKDFGDENTSGIANRSSLFKKRGSVVESPTPSSSNEDEETEEMEAKTRKSKGSIPLKSWLKKSGLISKKKVTEDDDNYEGGSSFLVLKALGLKSKKGLRSIFSSSKPSPMTIDDAVAEDGKSWKDVENYELAAAVRSNCRCEKKGCWNCFFRNPLVQAGMDEVVKTWEDVESHDAVKSGKSYCRCERPECFSCYFVKLKSGMGDLVQTWKEAEMYDTVKARGEALEKALTSDFVKALESRSFDLMASFDEKEKTEKKEKEVRARARARKDDDDKSVGSRVSTMSVHSSIELYTEGRDDHVVGRYEKSGRRKVVRKRRPRENTRISEDEEVEVNLQ